MRYNVSTSPSEDDVADFRREIRAFNQLNVTCDQVHGIDVFATNDDNKTEGGDTGLIWGNWLQIQLLWVVEAQRDRGLVVGFWMWWSPLPEYEDVAMCYWICLRSRPLCFI
ncbi:hypothetical protein EKN38_25290 [Enterobacter sp. WCHEn045836]|uniref:hypothetical protein n=1 Tax=Enterobacter sp. WCHEn045836 TaxID=2497434 RepID=UPI000F8408F7|nr:hypothetical protein [Enterobacter sp. WCHEn045836]RTP93714.1 hypothetical protein EKN38_25290 [Enterobacter sp. WCHEn045836]